MKRFLLVLALAVFLPACYHATVITGARPGPEKIENRWASGWIYGLVPPATVEAMGRCPQGVAQVDTQLSFLNQLVSGLTLGIYTPMQISVTCAEGDEENLPEAGSVEEAKDLMKAGEPFLVRW
jgi:hypothetical protein